MNDPGPYRTTFSDLVGSTSAQDEFFESLLTFMQENSFDGVDIDWEYPVAEDRGGVEADFDNYPNFLQRMRERLNASGKTYGISITLVRDLLESIDMSTTLGHALLTHTCKKSALVVLVPPRLQSSRHRAAHRLVQHNDLRYPYVHTLPMPSRSPFQTDAETLPQTVYGIPP